MMLRLRTVRNSSFLVLCCLSLMLLLTACDLFGGGSSSSSSTPTPKPTAPTVTAMTTYTGNGFTISYPTLWTPKTTSSGVSFSDSSNVATLSITVVDNPNGSLPLAPFVQQVLNASLGQSKNAKKVDMPATTKLAGETWNQSAQTGDTKKNGQTVNTEFVVLTTDHPAKSPTTKTFLIAYGTATQLFDSANITVFQPMLQSFRFA